MPCGSLLLVHGSWFKNLTDSALIERFRPLRRTKPGVVAWILGVLLLSMSFVCGEGAFPLKMNVDDRGSFTELVHTLNAGQVSINISKPGITKGQHWHNTKFEQFIVVKGHGLIQQRNLNDPEGKVLEWEVSGDKIQAVHMLPGYTHNIINLSETEDLVTVM